MSGVATSHSLNQTMKEEEEEEEESRGNDDKNREN